MDVVLKTEEQVAQLLGEPFTLPEGVAYQATFDGSNVMVGVNEPLVAQMWATEGLPALCDVLTQLIGESQRTPGLPVVYGPRGVERRQYPRLRAVS